MTWVLFVLLLVEFLYGLRLRGLICEVNQMVKSLADVDAKLTEVEEAAAAEKLEVTGALVEFDAALQVLKDRVAELEAAGTPVDFTAQFDRLEALRTFVGKVYDKPVVAPVPSE